MKQTFLSLLFLLIATCGWAQKVWENPTSLFFYSDYFDIKVSKVELSEKETVLHLIYESRYGIKFSFAKATYLKTPDGKQYRVTSGKATNAEEKDMPVGEMYWPDTLSIKFALHFEPLPANVECFHLIEGKGQNAFRIFNITEGKPADMSELFNSNWRNDQTGDWQLGLYADNAVYDSKVWKYEEKNDKKIVLTDGQEKVTIEVGKEKAGKRQFIINGQKVTLSSFGSVLPAYPTADNTAFSTEYKDGEAVISGWIKDLPRDIYEGKISITAKSANFVTGVPLNANTTTDELGRFTMTVKLNGAQTVRFTEAGDFASLLFAKDIVLEPGKHYYMVHDWKNGCCLFMGENARLQNELASNPCDIETNPFWQLHGYDKMMTEFKDRSLANYDKATNQLNDIIAKNPNISRRYRDYVNERNRIVAASEIQDLMNDKNGTLTDEFVSAINKITVFNPTVPISLAPGFGQYQYLRNFSCERGIRQEFGQTPKMYLSLEQKGMIKYSDSEHDFLKRWQQREKRNDEKPVGLRGQKLLAFMHELDEICTKSEIQEFVDKENIKKVYDEFVLNPYLSKCRAIDSLSNAQIMRDYGRAVWLCHELADCRKLKEGASTVINEIKNDYFRQQVINQRDYYAELVRQNEEAVKKVIAPASNVEGLTDGKAIIDKIVEPYKGKIVYMDVWGTWCKPCIEDIKTSPKLKESVKDYDIVYIYFHIGGDMEESPDVWKGAIAELGLTKPNYVHYLIPRPQQKMVTDYLKVEGYPSYYLFDKQGNMEKLDRGHMGNIEGFKKKIDELSKK